MKSEQGLPRQLTLWDAVGVLVGSVIGSAIFKVAKEMTQLVHTPFMVMAVWVGGGVVSFMGGLTFAELGTRYPTAGGMYVYLRENISQLWAFLYGWSLFLIIQTGSIAAVAAACADYTAELVPAIVPYTKVFAVCVIAGLSVLNALSTRLGATMQNVSSVLKCLGIVGLIVMTFTSGQTTMRHFTPLVSDSLSLSFVLAIGAALVSAMWAYDGWYQVGNIAGEMKDPDRDVPRALFLGLSIVCVLYGLVSMAYMMILSPAEVMKSERIAADTARVVMGVSGAQLISLAVAISTFGCVNGMTISGPRVYYAMSRDGMLPAILGEPHPTYLTPFWAILLQGVWSIVLVLIGKYDQLYNYVMFVGWMFYGLAGVGLIVERRRRPDVPCYRAWGFPYTTGIFVAASIFCLIATFYDRPGESGAGILILAVGAAVYHVRKRQTDAA